MSNEPQPKGFYLWLAQDGKCFHCGKPMLTVPAKKVGGSYDRGWTREHIVPRKLGGRNANNIVLACVPCNSRRGHSQPTEMMLRRCAEVNERARDIRAQNGRSRPTPEAARG